MGQHLLEHVAVLKIGQQLTCITDAVAEPSVYPACDIPDFSTIPPISVRVWFFKQFLQTAKIPPHLREWNPHPVCPVGSQIESIEIIRQDVKAEVIEPENDMERSFMFRKLAGVIYMVRQVQDIELTDRTGICDPQPVPISTVLFIQFPQRLAAGLNALVPVVIEEQEIRLVFGDYPLRPKLPLIFRAYAPRLPLLGRRGHVVSPQPEVRVT